MKKIAIVGMRYIDKKFNLNPKLSAGCNISLFEEDNNKYDKKAIKACYIDENGKINHFGYVAKNNNDGSINTNLVYEIVFQSYKVIYIAKSEDVYYKRMDHINNLEHGFNYHDKIDNFYIYNEDIEKDTIFDNNDDEMNDPYYRCLFWRGY